MRRTLFNLTIALLAFGISSLFVFNFYWKEEIRQLNLPVEQTKKIIENNEIAEIPVRNEEDIFINDRINAFFPILRSWMKNKKIDEYIELKDAELTAHTKLLDVDGDKVKELAIQTNCAAVGNCEFWIQQKHLDGFNIILKTEMVQTFELKKTKTNGYFDLETTAHGSAISGEMNIYKFSGDKYKIDKCFRYEYEPLTKKNGDSIYTKDGQRIMKNKPIITHINCKNY